MIKKQLFLLLSLCLVFLTGCHSTDYEEITSINIIDRNGLSQTINEKGRLSAFQKTNFLTPQPYQKVQRVYGRDEEGNSRSYITSYHPNGQVKQYLEACNNRAQGVYKEWFSDGTLKIESYVIGGVADLNTTAEESWLFEGLSYAYDEKGKLLAEILYHKGELEGESKYYHPQGALWKKMHFEKNLLEGEEIILRADGALFQKTFYVKGKKEGRSERYWENGEVAFRENYKENRLMEAVYYDKTGKMVSEITLGTGFRALFGKEHLEELQEFKEGVQDGVVRLLGENNQLISTYSVKQGEKEGEEIIYFANSTQPKLQIHWHNGQLSGQVKTWYPNGNLESIKEMSLNKKNGLFSAWYRDGFLMLVEEYDNDKLVKGDYFRHGEKLPVSRVEHGKGVASLFEPDGKFGKKISYNEGKPVE